MFDNIGRKIKDLAEIIFVIEALLFFGIGLYFIIALELVGVGVILMLLGPLISWVSSWLLYGFGEIIDLLTDIKYNTQNLNTKTNVELKKNEKGKNAIANKTIKTVLIKDKKNAPNKANNFEVNFGEKELQDVEFIDVTCPECNELLSFEKDFKSGECPACGAAIKLMIIKE